MKEFYDTSFSRFDTRPGRDGQTDVVTAYLALCVASSG